MPSDEWVLSGYLNKDQLAQQLNKTTRTIERWARQRIGPPVTRVGRKPFYSIESVRSWLKSREQPMVRERRGAV
jgi:hypothetical protein